MRLVLDTNIVVSAFIKSDGKPSQIVKMILGRKAELYYNEVIISEYESVMSRSKFADKIDSNMVHRFTGLLKSIGVLFMPDTSSIELPDESDRIFYDTAKESGSVLISGNIKHYPKEPFIVQPADFLERFASGGTHRLRIYP